MNEFDLNKNKNTDSDTFEKKLNYLRNELLDKEKCREFSEKLCEYINKSRNN